MSTTKEIALRDSRIALKDELKQILGDDYQVILLGGGASKWLSIVPLSPSADLELPVHVAAQLGIDLTGAIVSGGALLL